MIRAAEAGTGIIAGGPVRAIFEALGVHDVVAKSVGTSNPHNMIKAAFDALQHCNSPRSVAARRSKKVERHPRQAATRCGRRSGRASKAIRRDHGEAQDHPDRQPDRPQARPSATTLIGLGLEQDDRSNVVEDTPSIRGMVDKVAHLLRIEPAN